MKEFMEQYELVYGDLYRLAYYYLGNAHEAEDAVMDTVLAAYEGYEKLRNPEAFKNWIFKILVNQCKRRMRSFYVKQEKLTEESSIHEPDYTDKAYIQSLLLSLSGEERLIVSLIVFGGYKGEEVADLLQKKHSTIRSKYRRAIEKLKKQLDKEAFSSRGSEVE